MRVLLIAANTERINMPSLPLGLALVATAAHQAGHEMTFLDLLSVAHPDQEVRRAIATASPEAIGISVRNIDDQDMQSRCFLLEPVKELMATCRDCTKAPLILGGAGYSIFPEAALAYLGADLGVYGEGEILFPALLVKLQQGADPRELPGIYSAGHCCQTERGIAADLKTLPLPDSRFWVTLDPTTPDLWIPVQTHEDVLSIAVTVRPPSSKAGRFGVDGRKPWPNTSGRWPKPVSAAFTSWTTPSTFLCPIRWSCAGALPP